jgi:hypothetical protein
MGRFVRDLLLEQKLFDLLFPRIPVAVMKEITNKLKEYDERKKTEKSDTKQNETQKETEENQIEQLKGRKSKSFLTISSFSFLLERERERTRTFLKS